MVAWITAGVGIIAGVIGVFKTLYAHFGEWISVDEILGY